MSRKPIPKHQRYLANSKAANDVKRAIVVAAIVVGVCAAYVLAHLALIEVGREVVVV